MSLNVFRTTYLQLLPIQIFLNCNEILKMIPVSSYKQ